MEAYISSIWLFFYDVDDAQQDSELKNNQNA